MATPTPSTAKFPKDPNAIVRLSVGDRKHTVTTTVRTLTKHSAYFKALARDSGDRLPTLGEDTFFIDRDGRAFDQLLCFMRGGTLPLRLTIVDLARNCHPLSPASRQ